MKSLAWISKIAIALLLLGCSSNGDFQDKSPNSETEQNIETPLQDANITDTNPKPEGTTPEENPNPNPEPEKEKREPLPEKPYINPFQPDTTPNPNAPQYVEPKIEREYIGNREVRTLPKRIEQDIQLSKNYLWKIDGTVEVVSGIQFQREAGTTRFGEDATSSIHFQPNSSIIAIGKKESPIIWTSREDLEKGISSAGQWRGIELDSVVNSVLKYNQIRYSGSQSTPSIRLKNISYQNILEYVEIYQSSYDGIEIDGGDVNLRNTILLGVDGDSISINNGWSGKMQNIYIQQSSDRFGDKSSGIDIHNIEGGIFSNIEIRSSARDVGAGIYIRNGLDIELYNSIITGERISSCIEGEKVSSQSKFEANIIGGCQGGSHKNIDIDSDTNYISTKEIDWNEANRTTPINPYVIDSWFDEYPRNYIGATANRWWRGWSIGVEE